MKSHSTLAVSELTVLITGGARGIGAATATLLSQEGAKVLLTDVLDDEGEQLAESLGPNVFYQHLDVTNETQWQQAVQAAQMQFGRLDALFNNAGVVLFESVDQTSPEAFRRVLDINLFGVFLGIQAVIPAMREAGRGVIVNTSSTAGLQGYAGLAGYVASKWAVRGLTKASALDLAPDHIRVLSIHPGPVRTPMTAQMPDAAVVSQPMPRFGDADEVARMVKFMLTEATFSTGSEFVVDGGAVTGQVLPLK
jgi:3alpha(or 20beta)-hydroxysteroid dehydrogenase